MEDRAAEVYELIRHHSGYGHRHIPDEVLKAFIRYEWDSGRWAALRDMASDEITGWISWYNLDAASLEEVKNCTLPGCYQHKVPLAYGPHCYISNVVVKEGQEKKHFRLLWNLACQKNRAAETISAHLCNRPPEGGKPHCRWFSRVNPLRGKLREVEV